MPAGACDPGPARRCSSSWPSACCRWRRSAPPRRADPASPGPPFPDPVTGQRVYDYAGIFSPDAIADAEEASRAIEARTGAQVVVYTQPNDTFDLTTEETESRALALINQWGIGRKGFDDGMVLFFDLDPTNRHGQVQLYAAPGFEAAYLSNSERQSIYENDMLPYLRSADFDGALAAAMLKIDKAATAEHAASLQRGRQIDAAVGLIGAPIVFLGLVGWAFFHWRRFGKDPVYLDDPSVLMPAPPPDLTAASGAMVMDGHTSRRALTTAMLDLASRGKLSFREENGLLSHKVGIDVDPPAGDPTVEAQRSLNARRPIGPAETTAFHRLETLSSDSPDGYITPDDLPKFGTHVDEFDKALERHVVSQQWFARGAEQGDHALGRARHPRDRRRGDRARHRGQRPVRGSGHAGRRGHRGRHRRDDHGPLHAGRHDGRRDDPGHARRVPADAREDHGPGSLDAAGRRRGRSEWLETPDQAVVWGTALGLQHEIESVLARSMEDVTKGAARPPPYFPLWYTNSSGSSFASAAAAGSGGSIFSGSAVPDLGGMMSALGTIGNAPSSSGGGGGGFGGGGGGGGGGGAGGGF